MSIHTQTPGPSAVKTILKAGFIAGTLDILTAIISYSITKGQVSAAPLLQYVASGVFGQEAFTGGIPMALYGLLFHYIIAFSFAIGYFLVFPYLPFLRKYWIISGLLYGVFAWCITNLIVLPLSNVQMGRFTTAGVVRSMIILMLMIGVPISWIVCRHYTRKQAARSVKA